MKKKVLIVLTALAALSLSACSDIPSSPASQVEREISSTPSVITTESEADSGTKSTSLFEQVKESSGKSESVAEEQPVMDNISAETSIESVQSQAQQPITAREPEQLPQAPVSTEPTAPPASQPSTPPAQKPEPMPEPAQPYFDVTRYVGYAKSYGQGIGLTLDSTATTCWDDPITANAGCIYLERDIRDRLDWYLASGYTAFWVWSVDNGGGNYQIYIGYA
jgi:TolA-binding protein